MTEENNYAAAMAHLEAGCHTKGIASIKFKDGEMVMISLDLLRKLANEAESKNQDRVLIFIGTGPILEGATA